MRHLEMRAKSLFYAGGVWDVVVIGGGRVVWDVVVMGGVVLDVVVMGGWDLRFMGMN